MAYFSLGKLHRLVSLVKHGDFCHYSWVNACISSGTWNSNTLSNENILVTLQNQRSGKVGGNSEFKFHLPSVYTAVAYTLLRGDGGSPEVSAAA